MATRWPSRALRTGATWARSAAVRSYVGVSPRMPISRALDCGVAEPPVAFLPESIRADCPPTNKRKILWRQLDPVRTVVAPILCVHILNVLEMGSQPQVRQIHTAGTVTGMAHLHAVRDWAMRLHPCCSPHRRAAPLPVATGALARPEQTFAIGSEA